MWSPLLYFPIKNPPLALLNREQLNMLYKMAIVVLSLAFSFLYVGKSLGISSPPLVFYNTFLSIFISATENFHGRGILALLSLHLLICLFCKRTSKVYMKMALFWTSWMRSKCWYLPLCKRHSGSSGAHPDITLPESFVSSYFCEKLSQKPK